MLRCNACGEDFSRADALTRHRKRKYPCVRKNSYEIDLNNSDRGVISQHTTDAQSEEVPSFIESQDIKSAAKYETNLPEKKDIIPTFDGDEFIGKKPLTRETLIKMMDMLNVPEEEREAVIQSELKRNCDLVKKRKQADLMEMIKMHTEEEDEEDQEESPKQDDVSQNRSIENGEFRDDMRNNLSDSEEEIEASSLPYGMEQVNFNDSSSSNSMKRPVIVKAPHLNSKEKELLNQFSRLFQEMNSENSEDTGEELCILLDKLQGIGTLNAEDCKKAFVAIEDAHNKLSN